MNPVGCGRLRVIRDSKLRDLQMSLKGHRWSEVMMPLDQVPNGERFLYVFASRTDRLRVAGDASSFFGRKKQGGTPIQYVTARKPLGRYGIFLTGKELRQ